MPSSFKFLLWNVSHWEGPFRGHFTSSVASSVCGSGGGPGRGEVHAGLEFSTFLGLGSNITRSA